MTEVPKYMRAFDWGWNAGYKAGFASGKYHAYDKTKQMRRNAAEKRLSAVGASPKHLARSGEIAHPPHKGTNK